MAVGIALTKGALLAAIIVPGNVGLVGSTAVAYRGRVRLDEERGDVA